MPASNNIINYVKRAINASKPKMPTSATVIRVDGNLADIRLEGHSTNLANCRIAGNPLSIKVGMLVSVVWEDYNGVPRPVVQGPGGEGVGLSASGTPGSVLTDNVTIENSYVGLRVKLGSITPAHLSFDTLEDQMTIGTLIPGWSATPDGILVGGDLTLNPRGELTLGYDPDIVKLSSYDSTYRIWAGSSTPAVAPFSVSKTGQLISSSAVIAGWTITGTQIKKTGIILDSAADAIYVGASNEIELDGADATIYVGSGSPQIVIDGQNKILKSSNFQAGVEGFGLYANNGSAEFHNVTVRGTIRASVFNIGEISGTAGTYGVFKSASEVYTTVTTPSSINTSFYLDAKDSDADASLFAVGDLLRIKSWDGTNIYDVWCTITALANNSGYTRYTCNLESGTSQTITKGTAAIDYGQTDDGQIMLSADDTVGASANMSITSITTGIVETLNVVVGGSAYTNGDNLTLIGAGSNCLATATVVGGVVQSLAVNAGGHGYVVGTTYSTTGGTGTGCTASPTSIDGPWSGNAATIDLKARIGNMYGSFGAGAVDRYGFGVGDYDNGNYISYNADVADGFLLKAGSGSVTLDETGVTISATTIYSEATSLSWEDTGNNKFYYLRGRTNAFGAVHYYEGELALEPPSGLEAYMKIRTEGAGVGDEARITLNADALNDYAPAYIDIYNTYSASNIKLSAYTYVQAEAVNINLKGATMVDDALQVRGETLNNGSSGSGLELGWFTSGTYGRILSYDRGTPAYRELRLMGSAITFYEGATKTLTIDGGDAYTNAFADYSGSSTTVGWSSFSEKEIYYKTVGDLVFVTFNLQGTSNSATTTFTVPYLSKNSTNYRTQFICRAENSGVWSHYPGMCSLPPNSNTVVCYLTNQAGAFGNTGGKSVIGQFFYQRA